MITFEWTGVETVDITASKDPAAARLPGRMKETLHSIYGPPKLAATSARLRLCASASTGCKRPKDIRTQASGEHLFVNWE
jgi:hypothetical protein